MQILARSTGTPKMGAGRCEAGEDRVHQQAWTQCPLLSLIFFFCLEGMRCIMRANYEIDLLIRRDDGVPEPEPGAESRPKEYRSTRLLDPLNQWLSRK